MSVIVTLMLHVLSHEEVSCNIIKSIIKAFYANTSHNILQQINMDPITSELSTSFN